jgi:hypothetical protein
LFSNRSVTLRSSCDWSRSVEVGPEAPALVVAAKVVVEVELSTATPEFDVSW